MSEVVADASALVEALVAPSGKAAARLGAATIHAPHLVDVEVLHALRSLSARGLVEQAVAVGARATLLDVVTHRYGHEALLARMWELRANVRTYDAAYVALAEALDVPLLTLDARLAAAPGLRCHVETL
ncbi:MAG: hypothetical protein AVDCRST_MAG79-967 [uncultured Thermoleophilia bacterium]|uniref:Ribonuclease VapC n=1 Tax=uncultured Thermoleophilia bacterium TaxID=1497501 RepID=A0A6J4TT03_9ACTN|nr:MAG: hypothetical protein AVDCRST_MAG79-967 [uncultured Thermoleophilia bacterium]